MASLELKQVSKSWGADKTVLRNLNLRINEGQVCGIVGFSGIGKTTLISLLAGLTEPSAGSILCEGKAIHGPGLERGVVFQNYALFPWLSVFDNILLALRQSKPGWSVEDQRVEVERLIDLVHLTSAAQKKPGQLSGGMRQRTALARALAVDPKVLLMDEPLSALDAITRHKLQDEVAAILALSHKTAVLITNDVDEAIRLCDVVVPLLPDAAGATFGSPFEVNLPRPREETRLNKDPRYKELKARITNYLARFLVGRPEEGEEHPLVKARRRTENLKGSPYLKLKGLTKSFANSGVPTVEGFDLEAEEGEFVALIGHSGCGKSTVLSMIAGLTAQSSGEMSIGQSRVVGPGPDRGVVFQSPTLVPWLTAQGNVELAVKQAYPAAGSKQVAEIARYYLTKVGLEEVCSQRSRELSQGMRQRVGIARAFSLSPKLLLMDEPFGMLDSFSKMQLHEVLLGIWQKTRVTALIVTHDVDEAILLSDRIVVMTAGPRAKVGVEIRVHLPRPRNPQECLKDPEYYRLRNQVLDALRRFESRHPLEKRLKNGLYGNSDAGRRTVSIH